jgi:serine/threonine-protein kinase HipA
MDHLNVFLNGEKVGVYHRESTGEQRFEYHPEWKKTRQPISLSLPIGTGPFRGKEVQNVFENLLPDDAQTRREIAENTQAEGDDTFSLLYEIGRDCVGAFQFLPEGKTPNSPQEIQVNPLSENDLVDRILSLEQKPLNVSEDETFRISLAGSHEKSALLRHKNQWSVPLNTTPSSHIFKPQHGENRGFFDLDENEFFCMKLCENLGLSVANIDFRRFKDESNPRRQTTCLIIERFDREFKNEGIYRIHCEDFCQALGLARSQKRPDNEETMIEVFELLQESSEPATDQLRFIQHQIIQWFIGADDGHLKNFSLYLSGENAYRLTEFYDISSGEPYNKDNPQAPDDFPYPKRHNPQRVDMTPELAIPLAGSGKTTIRDIHPSDLCNLAEYSILDRSTIKESFSDIVETLPKALKKTLDQTGDTVPRFISDPIKHSIENRLKTAEDFLTETNS